MMFEWNPGIIRFMKDAFEYGSYSRELADTVIPYLSGESRVCDAGCGLGYLSLELAEKAGRVTSVDVSADALAVLRENCEKRGVSNIDILCGDLFSMPPDEKYTAMVFCYFGDVDSIVRYSRRFCSGPVFIFKRNYEMHRFSAGGTEKADDSFEEACRRFEKHGVSFRTLELENEFGQPFRSLDDVRKFFELYNQSGSGKAATDLFAAGSIINTGRDDFPFYMPFTKRTGCIIINPLDLQGPTYKGDI